MKFLNRFLRVIKRDPLVCEKCQWYYYNPKMQSCHIYQEGIDSRIIVGEKKCSFYDRESIFGYFLGFMNIIENHT